MKELTTIRAGESYAYVGEEGPVWANVIEVWDNPDRRCPQAKVELDICVSHERVGNYPRLRQETVYVDELEPLSNHPHLT